MIFFSFIGLPLESPKQMISIGTSSNNLNKIFIKNKETRSRSDQTFFFSLLMHNFSVFLAIKLGNFIVNSFFSHVTKSTQAYQLKSENEQKQSLVKSTPDLGFTLKNLHSKAD